MNLIRFESSRKEAAYNKQCRRLETNFYGKRWRLHNIPFGAFSRQSLTSGVRFGNFEDLLYGKWSSKFKVSFFFYYTKINFGNLYELFSCIWRENPPPVPASVSFQRDISNRQDYTCHRWTICLNYYINNPNVAYQISTKHETSCVLYNQC